MFLPPGVGFSLTSWTKSSEIRRAQSFARAPLVPKCGTVFSISRTGSASR
ncbi:MAG: hypothetical protein BWY06_02731 [Candidatus Latescibacteria bacterium ADurb.Bin168]|nr:MAG: hypothetical protein BWY06_02731 [Candidatus Latescibacteria bacterium ADurb.Bin168]